ncbi:MAG: thiamine biosynthesis protein ThiS [Pseudonocardiales bacterium]|nr:MAG: thiamine biosynthesis protein ThiS [Pseudonocardiales bacterium]
MNITVNGEDRRVGPGTTLAELVEQVAGSGRGTAAAVDGTVVPRGGWPAERLRDGVVVELVTAVQGG